MWRMTCAPPVLAQRIQDKLDFIRRFRAWTQFDLRPQFALTYLFTHVEVPDGTVLFDAELKEFDHRYFQVMMLARGRDHNGAGASLLQPRGWHDGLGAKLRGAMDTWLSIWGQSNNHRVHTSLRVQHVLFALGRGPSCFLSAAVWAGPSRPSGFLSASDCWET